MSFSMYAACVPPMRHMLNSLKAVLAKAEAHCTERKIEPEALLTARLFPDMLPFTRQVQIASDNAKAPAARLAGVEVPKMEDTEKTFAELQARLDKTIAFLDTLKPEQFEGADERDIVLPMRTRTLEFKGATYLTTFALPNFHFHVTTAYAILRHNGVEIGKTDFLGGGRSH
jgi:hypothetical protein